MLFNRLHRTLLVVLPVLACDPGGPGEPDPYELPPIVPCDPAPGRICTLAGTGEAGLGGEGLDPRQTDLYLPQDTTIGPDERVYVIDWNNHRIRRINADGTTETIVGTGELGDAMDGEGAYSNLNHPTHMVVAPNGKFIIAAWHNSKIMEFDPDSGDLVTICGNGMRAFGGDGDLASKALLDLPTATAFDSVGNMYITDQANQRIRMVDTDGIITTKVGNGMPGYSGDGGPADAAQIKLPGGQSAPPAGRITVDRDGNLIIADSANNVIRKVDTTGTISTIAGNTDPTYGGDGGPATEASLSRPSDVDFDRDGNLYIADTDNSCVRKVDGAGIITTVAGVCGQPGYGGDGDEAGKALLDRPYGVTVDDDGNLYIADTHNHRIRVVYK
ncbi:MAG: hypothetical protein JNL82_05970 [Myxococcales bacterium]|nr:hypothetical protein [Myxococcales bacterium]